MVPWQHLSEGYSCGKAESEVLRRSWAWRNVNGNAVLPVRWKGRTVFGGMPKTHLAGTTQGFLSKCRHDFRSGRRSLMSQSKNLFLFRKRGSRFLLTTPKYLSIHRRDLLERRRRLLFGPGWSTGNLPFPLSCFDADRNGVALACGALESRPSRFKGRLRLTGRGRTIQRVSVYQSLFALFSKSARGGTRTRMPFGIRPSNVRVCHSTT